MRRTRIIWRGLFLLALSQVSFGTPQLTAEIEHGQIRSVTHRVFDAHGRDYIGGKTLIDSLPTGYENFLIMWVDYKTHPSSALRGDTDVRTRLIPDSGGKITVEGRVVFKGPGYPQGNDVSDGKYTSYEFKDAYILEQKDGPTRLVFDTRVVDGVSYRFEGTYFEADAIVGEKELHLSGQMIRFTNGTKSSETILTFRPVHGDH